jgi:HPt (histidine-containing phosphotransfer) domain-containing protein
MERHIGRVRVDDRPPARSATVLPPADPGPVLDEAVIAELRQIGGGEALFLRVLDLFASRVPQAMDKVEAMGEAPDRLALADAVHALKSMCANIGARRAVAACHELEHAARTGQAFDAGASIGRIAAEMRLVMAEVAHLRRLKRAEPPGQFRTST